MVFVKLPGKPDHWINLADVIRVAGVAESKWPSCRRYESPAVRVTLRSTVSTGGSESSRAPESEEIDLEGGDRVALLAAIEAHAWRPARED